MEFEVYSVGERRSEWQGRPDGYVMEYSKDNGLVMYCFLHAPSPEEIIEHSAKSDFSISFSSLNGIGFFSVKFGKLPVGDCPFTPNLYAERPTFAPPEAGMGLSLIVFLVDTRNGELKVIRQLGLSEHFTEAFVAWCKESLQYSITADYYNQVVNTVYATMDSDVLAKKAIVHCKILGRDNDWRSDRELERRWME